MKILVILTGGLRNDGISLGTIGYFEAMNREDINIDFIAINDIQKEIAIKIRQIGCNIIEIGNRKKNPLKYCYNLYKLMKRNRYDIVHVHGSSSLLFLELGTSKLAKIPIRIAHSRNTTCNNKKIDKLLRPLFYWSLTDCFACGEEAGKWLFENKSFTVISNGKDLRKFKYSKEKREAIRDRYNLSNNLAICHIGRFNYQKNHDFLIDIFHEINKVNSNAMLFLIGKGALIESIKNKVNELNLIKNVVFVGEIDNINEIIQGMDIMVMPSRFEGLPNVVIEAQISGLPCIISDTITEECKITELVHFESLDSNPKIWAEKVLNTKIVDREVCNEKIINQVRNSGYDIVENAKKLKKIYIDLYNKNN